MHFYAKPLETFRYWMHVPSIIIKIFLTYDLKHGKQSNLDFDNNMQENERMWKCAKTVNLYIFTTLCNNYVNYIVT